MSTIDEGSLRFHFADGWIVRRADDQHEFYGKLLRSRPTKAVDFVAWSREQVVFVEVKDFRNAFPANRHRLSATQAGVNPDDKL
jgi:hypothetical protein